LPNRGDADGEPGTGDAPEIEVLFSAETIADRVTELGREIARTGDGDLLAISILKGSFVFAADLLRALHGAGLRPEVDFIFLASYGTGTTSTGEVRVVRDVETDVRDRRVLLVDDILESGRTLAHARDLIAARGASLVETCVLLDKQVARARAISPDYRGFVCPDSFVVGYGMDLAHRHRELPFIGRIRHAAGR
jgi:hypoxanthine phosphoribosyltransferase